MKLRIRFLFVLFVAFAASAQGPPPSILRVIFLNQGYSSANVEWKLSPGTSTSPGVLRFASQQPGGGGTPPVGEAIITLTNEGPVTVHMVTPYFSGENSKDFTFVSHCPTYLMFRDPKVIPPGVDPHTQCQIVVTFKPSAPGPRYGTLWVPFIPEVKAGTQLVAILSIIMPS